MRKVYFKFSGGYGILSDSQKARLKQQTLLEEIQLKYAAGQSVTRWLRIDRLIYILRGYVRRLRKI